jgi:hypothetical protein
LEDSVGVRLADAEGSQPTTRPRGVLNGLWHRVGPAERSRAERGGSAAFAIIRQPNAQYSLKIRS